MNVETSWFQRFTRATFDVLVPLVNIIAPDRGRARSSLLKVPILVDRHLMSSPTYASSSYVVDDGVIRLPEQFPTYNKSLREWSAFIASNELLRSILGLPKSKPVEDTNSSVESSESSEDKSEGEDMEQEVALEMLENVPESLINNAAEYEASVNSLHHQQMIESAMQYVCLLYFFLIVG